MESFTMNELIYDLHLGLLIESPFSTGDLKNVLIKIIVLSHGKTSVESGFSINEQMSRFHTNISMQQNRYERAAFSGSKKGL